MPETQFRAQRSPSPRQGPSMLPPLSKYYYGPAQGWTSAESSPSHNGSTWSLNKTTEIPPSLPPRLSPGPPAYTSPQWNNSFPRSEEAKQGWQLPGPPPSAPPGSHFTNALYDPINYALMPGAGHSPVNPTWDSAPTDSPTWGLKYNHKEGVEPAPKPPLPPRPTHPYEKAQSDLISNNDQHRMPHKSNNSYSRLSATTIDVPLFLQPVAYDPGSAPPIPQSSQQGDQSPLQPSPESERLPPPPPMKIPLNHEGELQSRKVAPRRPQYDPQHSFDGQQPQIPQAVPRRPRFDPQNSHEDGSSPYQRQNQEQQPSIPPPHFTSFNVESALPPAQHLVFEQPQGESSDHKNDSNRNCVGQQFHQLSISPVGSNDTDRSMSNSSRWEPRLAYVSSPEQQHATLSHQDAQSISTADLLSTSASVSTPETQQTSNTSYHKSENHTDPSKLEGQTDDSFYWHSGRSSSDAEEYQSRSGSPTATPGEASIRQRSSPATSNVEQREHQDLPVRSTSLSSSTYAPYSASALGFGGPSDWEYFGDYEAEEIDDEDLYSRPRPRETTDTPGESAELSADSPPIDIIERRKESEIPSLDTASRGKPPLPEGPPARRLKSGQSQAAQRADLSNEGDESTGAALPLAQSPTTSRAILSDAIEPSHASPDQQRPDLDEIIRAWSEAPYVGKVQYKASDKEKVLSNDEDVAEASLASTPRERILGVDTTLKDAPSSPKLPASLDQTSSEEANRRGSRASIEHSAIKLKAQDPAPQAHATPNHHKLKPERPSTLDIILTSGEMPDPIKIEKTQIEHSTESLTNYAAVSSKSTDTVATEPYGSRGESGLMASDGEPEGTIGLRTMPGPPRAEHHNNAQDVFVENLQEKETSAEQDTLQQHTQKHPNLLEHEDAQGEVQETLPDILREFELVQQTSQINLHNAPATGTRQSSQETLQATVAGALKNTAQGDPLENLFDASHEESPRPCSTAPSQKASQEVLIEANSNLAKDSGSLKTDGTTEPPTASSNNNSNPPQVTEVIEEPTRNTKQPTSNNATPLSPTISNKNNDPYADLDPWGRASLNRFAAMLREEARAESNKDKLNIFNVFTSRESRLRVILYGTEDELIVEQKHAKQKQDAKQNPEVSGFVKQAIESANTMNLQRSLKELPALPANRESVMGLPGKTLAPLMIQDSSKTKEGGEASNEPSGEDSYVMVDSPSDGAQYSPGGRPKVSRSSKADRVRDRDPLKGMSSSSLKDDTSSLQEGESTKVVISRSSEVPTTVGLEDATEPKKPAYTPFKYSEGRSEVNNYLANRKSVCRPYATLTQGSLESGSNFGREPNTSDAKPYTVAAPRSQFNTISQVKGDGVSDKPSRAKPKAPGTEGPPDLRRFVKADFDPLILVLPDSEAVVREPARLDDLRNIMEALPDDFSFIHQSVVAWDSETKKQREENDRQRHARQVESEQRIDSLFDDHEIGYGDISELESEFKRSEAARKADEDRSEYQTFVSDVFNIVWTRLHYELDQLIPHYNQYTKLMNETLAGKDMFESSEGGLALAPTMSSLLALHQKLEIRHQKAFEAVLERDRRLKKTEISPWYTLSNIAKVKQLEKQFEDAEKKAIIEYCQHRDTRANRLMDVLDQNTLRGVGANQDYMEAIMKAVRRIASGRAFASVPGSNGPTAGLEEVENARVVTAQLATSSEQIVQTFHVADMLLNSADYEVSVAKAKVARADMATLAKLKEEKAKEDQKLMRDLEHRLALIREDSRRTNDEIVKLMLFLGVQNGQGADVGPPQAGHEARIQKALEEAKRRNALKESGV